MAHNPRQALIADMMPRVGRELLARERGSAAYSDRKGYLAEADLFVHQTMVSAIQKHFPTDQVLSEEDAASWDSGHGESGFLWILDPICGTTNFVHNIPFFAIGLSAFHRGEIVCAGIYDPMRDELFLSEKNGRSTLNGAPIQASSCQALSAALVSVNCNQSDLSGVSIGSLIAAVSPPVVRRVHVLESANLELAYVACGRLDAYINPSDKIWDIAAGSLMIANAGGQVTTFCGSVGQLTPTPGVIAGSPSLVPQLIALTGALPSGV